MTIKDASRRRTAPGRRQIVVTRLPRQRLEHGISRIRSNRSLSPKKKTAAFWKSSPILLQSCGKQWGTEIRTLRALDPNNQKLSYVAPPNWVPTNEDIADIRTEVGRVAVQRVKDFVMPGGNVIGEPGGNVDVRNLPGGAQAAQDAFDHLSLGGTPYGGAYPGKMVVLPSGVGWGGLRTNAQGIPTVDINLPGAVPRMRFHYR